MTDPQHALVSEIFAAARDISVATNRADGWPHVATVGFVADDLVLYFGCAAGSLQAQNLARDPRVSITALAPQHTARKPLSISLEGDAVFVTERGELGRVIELMITRYGAELASNGVIDLTQTRLVRVDAKAYSMIDCAISNGHGPQLDFPPRAPGTRFN